jgi:hypothetical protein
MCDTLAPLLAQQLAFRTPDQSVLKGNRDASALDGFYITNLRNRVSIEPADVPFRGSRFQFG